MNYWSLQEGDLVPLIRIAYTGYIILQCTPLPCSKSCSYRLYRL